MRTTTPNPPTFSPLEAGLLDCVNEFTSLVKELQSRVTQLETSVKTDSAIAQSQRKIIDDKLQELGTRLASLELSLNASSALLTAFEGQFLDLEALFATHRLSYRNAISAFREMQSTWQKHQGEYQALQSQVAHLTGVLRSLGA